MSLPIAGFQQNNAVLSGKHAATGLLVRCMAGASIRWGRTINEHPIIYLGVADAELAITFYAAAFGAEERYRLVGPDQSVMHAELSVAGTTLMLAETGADATIASSARFVLTVSDCDSATARASAAGGEVLRDPDNQFHGARQSLVRCTSGYEWFLSEQVEDVDVATIKARFAALFDA